MMAPAPWFTDMWASRTGIVNGRGSAPRAPCVILVAWVPSDRRGPIDQTKPLSRAGEQPGPGDAGVGVNGDMCSLLFGMIGVAEVGCLRLCVTPVSCNLIYVACLCCCIL